MAEMAATSQNEVQRIVEAYFIQLTRGCGDKLCTNPNCVTGGAIQPMDPNMAAATAVKLAKEQKNDICKILGKNLSNKTKAPTRDGSPAAMSEGSTADEPMEIESSGMLVKKAKPFTKVFFKGVTESEVEGILAQNDIKSLVDLVYNLFSNPRRLNCSFIAEGTTPSPQTINVNIDSVRRFYNALFELNKDSVINAIVNGIKEYSAHIKMLSLKDLSLNHIVILFENPLLHSPEFLDSAFPTFLSVASTLSIEQLVLLVNWYSNYTVDRIEGFVSALQQLITISALQVNSDLSHVIHSNSSVSNASHLLMIFYTVNLVMGRKMGKGRPHSTDLLSVAAKSIPPEIQHKSLNTFEMLLMRCDVHPSEMLDTPIKLTAFFNDTINEAIHMLADYKRQSYRMAHGLVKSTGKSFSFLDHPYLLNPANKVEKLFFDNQLSMINERHRTMFHAIITGIADIPFLLLRVDRHNLVGDTLAQLEAIADWNPSDLRKQLRVEFKDEEGIDEGGVQKEFFQLLIEKLFDPMNGMFLYDDTSHLHWFNCDSLESEQQYHLIGILLGLAIYNNIILDIQFPLVVYNKLLGCNTVFQDLYSSHPQIAKSLQSMLDFDEENRSFESTFMATFTASYTDMYMCQRKVCLKEKGDEIPVTKDNVQEFVKLYSDWLLNKSIEKQFNEFKKGFDVVMGESNMADLFTAEELELLICGNKEWDFNTLEENTQYDGFTKSHTVIQNFWEIFYEFSDNQKKRLLAFVTGSDRVPVGGLSKMKMVIVKNGPDSERLPTAHTCFNALLLCEYNTKDKLRERLEKAIENGKGFGML